MEQHLTTILLWLFVINLGIAFGAGLYEARVVIPSWKDLPRQTWPNTGLLFWVFVTTVPLTLLTLANAVAAWLEDGPRRFWWLTAAAITIVERLATFAHFIPTMVRLSGAPDLSDAEVRTGLVRWLRVNNGRHVLTFAAWLAALKALSSPLA
jgi:hypothetical protein